MVLWHPFWTSIHLNFSSMRRKGNEDGTDLNKPIEGQPRYKTKGIILKLNFKVWFTENNISRTYWRTIYKSTLEDTYWEPTINIHKDKFLLIKCLIGVKKRMLPASTPAFSESFSRWSSHHLVHILLHSWCPCITYHMSPFSPSTPACSHRLLHLFSIISINLLCWHWVQEIFHLLYLNTMLSANIQAS